MIRARALCLTAGLVTAIGCGGTTDSNTTPDSGAPPGPPQTFDYVINQITVDEGMGGMAPNPTTHAQGVFGFNLDGRNSPAATAMQQPADCAHGDFFSSVDADQNMGTCSAGTARGGASCQGGVDNQLPEIAATVQGFGTDIRMTLRDQLQQGKVSILIRVSDVNGTPGPNFNDDSVTVRLYPVGRPMFASCAMIGTPGAMYAVDNASLEGGTNIETNARYRYSGRIVNGRLVVNPPAAGGMANFTFNLPVQNMNIPLALFQTQLRVNMTPDRGTGGNLGGYVKLGPLASMIGMLLPAGIPPATVQTVLMSLVDIQDPAGNAMGCTAPNGGISLGLGFTTVRAQIAAAPVMGAQTGMCGSM